MIKDTLPVVHYYTQYDPYYFEVDNRPLKNLEARDLGLVAVLTEWENFFDTLVTDITEAIENFVPVPGDPGDPGDPGPPGIPGTNGLNWKGIPGPPGSNATGGASGQVSHASLSLIGPINMVEVYGHMDSTGGDGSPNTYVPAPTPEQTLDISGNYVAVGLRSVSDDGPNYKYLYLWIAPL